MKEFEELFLIASKNESDYDNVLFSKEGLQIFIGRNGLESSRNILHDESEFDLERISKSLEVENIRNSDPFAGSNFTGDLLTNESTDEILVELTEQLKAFSTKQYSISQLETYAKCPFKFLWSVCLALKQLMNQPKISKQLRWVE